MRWLGSKGVTIRLPGILAAMVALIPGVGAAGEATPQSMTPSEAPAAWVAYAEAVTTTLSDWLGEDGEAATRLRAYLQAARPAEDQPTPPLLLKVWIDRQGVVERLEFAPFAHEEANADLRTVVVGRRLAAPPPEMLLPLRIAIEITAETENKAEASLWVLSG